MHCGLRLFVNDTMLKQLPPADAEIQAAGLEGQWLLGVGNHEVWGDPKIEGVLNAMPYLKKLGVTPDSPIYKFDRRKKSVWLLGARYVNQGMPSSRPTPVSLLTCDSR